MATQMMPVRCYSCGRLVETLYARFRELLERSDERQALDELGVELYCCRRMLLSQGLTAPRATTDRTTASSGHSTAS